LIFLISSSCAFIDVEHALDATYARKLGVDLSTLLFNQPDNAEQAFDIMIELARTGAVDCIVCDSVSALTPEVEDEKDMRSGQPAVQARLMSKGLRKLTHHVSANNTIMLFVNQVRKKIGVMFGNPETTSGGNALRFYASIRLDIRRVKTLVKGTNKYGIRSRIRTIKNKVAPPFRDIHVDIHHNKGIVETYGDFVPGGKGAKQENEDE
jgi:recombination protein RecA